MPAKKDDALFAAIARFHGDRPWGRTLDAGTGSHSLGWLLSREPTQLTAVTGAPSRQAALETEYADSLRPDDRVITGNWTDPTLLHGECFDVVLADYLLGAIDGFAPYFQHRLFGRLKPHVTGRLYMVGMEPVPWAGDTEGKRIIVEINRLRDACILLAHHRTYREYPREWAIANLEGHGYQVDDAISIDIVYKRRYVNGQLDVCKRKLPYLRDRRLAAELGRHIEELRTRGLHHLETTGPIRFGSDYVISARPR